MSVAPNFCAPQFRSSKQTLGSSDPYLEAGLLLVAAIVRQVEASVGRVLSHDDMLSIGREGLVDAMIRFEPGRGAEFRTYASHRIRGAILDGMRREARMPRRAFAREWKNLDGVCNSQEVEAEPDDTLDSDWPSGSLAGFGRDGVDGGESPEDLVIRAQEARAVREAIHGLDPEHAELVQRYYAEGDSLQEISVEMGFAPGWGSRSLPVVREAMRRRLLAHQPRQGSRSTTSGEAARDRGSQEPIGLAPAGGRGSQDDERFV